MANRLKTTWPKQFIDYYSYDRISAMAAHALAQSRGPIIPIGVSMGGMVALEMWQQAPARIAALALFDTNPGSDTVARQHARDHQLDEARARGADGLRQLMVTHLIPSYFPAAGLRQSGTSPTDPHLQALVLAMAMDCGLDVLARQSAALATRRNYWPLLPGINVRALIGVGSHDQLCPPDQHKRMVSCMSSAEFCLIDDAGHLAPLEAPGASASAIQRLLTNLGGRVPRNLSEDARV